MELGERGRRGGELDDGCIFVLAERGADEFECKSGADGVDDVDGDADEWISGDRDAGDDGVTDWDDGGVYSGDVDFCWGDECGAECYGGVERWGRGGSGEFGACGEVRGTGGAIGWAGVECDGGGAIDSADGYGGGAGSGVSLLGGVNGLGVGGRGVAGSFECGGGDYYEERRYRVGVDAAVGI